MAEYLPYRERGSQGRGCAHASCWVANVGRCCLASKVCAGEMSGVYEQGSSRAGLGWLVRRSGGKTLGDAAKRSLGGGSRRASAGGRYLGRGRFGSIHEGSGRADLGHEPGVTCAKARGASGQGDRVPVVRLVSPLHREEHARGESEAGPATAWRRREPISNRARRRGQPRRPGSKPARHWVLVL